MKTVTSILAIIFLTSCTPTRYDYESVQPLLQEYRTEQGAESVFLNRITEHHTQIVLSVGNEREGMYTKMPNYGQNNLIEAMRLGNGCVAASAEHISTDFYRELALELKLNFLILCPTEIGYVGAGFEEVPPVQALAKMEDLAGEIDENL